MRLMVIADVEEKGLWDFYDPERTKGVDLILSCGDLDARYLEFLETMTNAPLYYVKGNHDTAYAKRPPEGCYPLDDKIVDFHGLRIMGLGGSMRYKPGDTMYTEAEMRSRIRRLGTRLALMNGIDILVTHAPAAGYGDMEDLPHHGFECFNSLMEKYPPKYMFFGHVHKEYGGFQREYTHPSGARLINACGSYFLDIEKNEYPAYGKTGSALYDLYCSLNMRKKKNP